MLGILEGIGVIGALQKVLTPQQTTTPVYTTPPGYIDKEQFKEVFKEAMEEAKSSETGSATTATAKNEFQDLSKLFTYLDVNKDGLLSKDEFGKLDDLMELMQTVS